MANNHIVDAGHDAMLQTIQALNEQRVLTCGAGKDIAEARRPAMLKRKGLTVGISAYASIFPHGYEARRDMPGLAPVRAHNHFYDQTQNYAPGYLPRVETIPDADDHRALIRDIESMRAKADLCVLSFHWGDHLRPFVLSDHERRTARLCIDHGADIVVGHHHHALRGIEWYKGKPIFYGLGHFVFDLRLQMTPELQAHFDQADPDGHAVFPRAGWPLLPMHPDTRMTLLGYTEVEDGEVKSAGFVPCLLRPDGLVHPVHPDSESGRSVIDYVNRCNQSQRLNARLMSEGAPVIGGHPSVRVSPAQ